jgi:PAS domain S-box-containing protein
MPTPPASAQPAGSSEQPDLAEVLFATSPTGILLLRPLYEATGTTIVDLAYERLNPAAQQQLRLPACPPESLLTLFPATAHHAGIFAFYCDTFLSGQLARHQFSYQHDGLDGYFHLVAQRQGDRLVVYFTDTTRQPLSAAEEALRASQALARAAQEQAAREQAERERQQLYTMFEQAPAMICIFEGPQHVFQFVNPAYQALVGERPLVGMPIAVAMPELTGQPIFGLLDRVYQTGETFHASEMLVQLDHHNEGRQELEQRYYNFIYQARHDLKNEIDGILVFAYEVTPQVQARQQVQHLNEELAATNEELSASNEEYLATNAALASTQQTLRVLNQELEARVQERTQQLAEQQQLLSQILSQVPAAVATLSGPEHRFSFFNEGYKRLTADRAQLGLRVAEALPEVVEQGFIELLDHVYTSGEPFYGREIAIILQRAGQAETTQYLDFTYQPLTDKQGQTQGILVFAVDVTAQVLARRQAATLQAAMLAVAQRQAQQRQELYQIFEQTPVAIVLLREPDHRIDYFNPAFRELFPPEQDHDSLHGHRVEEVYPRLKLAGLVQLLDRVFTTGEPQTVLEMPLANLQPDSPRYVTFAYQPYVEQDSIVGVAAFAYDVTEQVLARQQLQAQQVEFQALFEQAPVAICVFRGPDYVLELVNPLMGEMLGHDAAGLTGRPFFEALPELTAQGLRPVLDEVRRTGIPFRAHSQPIHLARHHAEEVGYFDFVYHPLLHPSGTLAIVCVATEVTKQVLGRQQVQNLNEELAALNEELTATNEELLDSNTQLTHTNTDLDTFVYSASHDLKSPITNIEGLLLALRQQLPPQALQASLVATLLDMMDGAVQRFQQTLGHLTDVSRLQQVMFDQPAESVDLPALIENLRLDMLPELTAAQATLTVEVDACPTVYFSSKTLRSILYNLLSNAIKYRAATRPAQVRLRCHPAGAGQLVLSVQDNGLGLSEKQQQELFKLFRRLHTHVSGSGVGLYMVKKMVDNAGGTLTVQSQPDSGSTFTVTLPLAKRGEPIA